jgi:hypothetical protein
MHWKGEIAMSMEHQLESDKVVIYNYDFKTQDVRLIHRGQRIPDSLKAYKPLWRVKDKDRGIVTIFIAL